MADMLNVLLRGQQGGSLQDHLLVNDSKCVWNFLTRLYLTQFMIEPIDQYISTFQWNTMKYRTDKSLQETTATLSQVKSIT